MRVSQVDAAVMLRCCTVMSFGCSSKFVRHKHADDDDGDATAEHGGARVTEQNLRQG